MSHRDDEHIVCEFLRKISPSREWEYLGEVEHHWIGELCESIRKHERAENAKLRELASINWFIALSERDALRIHGVGLDDEDYITALDETIDEARAMMHELGVELG